MIESVTSIYKPINDTKVANFFDKKELKQTNRDPFLNSRIMLTKIPTVVQNSSPKQKSIPSPKLEHSKPIISSEINNTDNGTENIRYLGLIKNNDTGEMLALITNNGKTIRKKIKENINNGITVVSFDSKTLTLRSGKALIIKNKSGK